ncbi:MAG: AbrB/MazE/SpoVT family DNA-binding domain-containing protein [Clostridia bacterium]|nr:AbrB/MazE/SpoVT family DNA-binding domain-containing protein [Clostridia bacterium]
MITTIQKWGNSSAVRLPKAVMEAVQMRDNDRVEIIPEGEKIIIMPKKPKRLTLDEIFEGWEGEYDFEEMITGTVGQEVL